MRQKAKAGSSLFLMELIIVLFFFLLTAAVCIQIFVKAHSISRSSLELSHAQSQCTSAAEVFSGTDGSAEAFLLKFPEGVKTENGVALYYDVDFQNCGKEEAIYCLTGEFRDTTEKNVVTETEDTEEKAAVSNSPKTDSEMVENSSENPETQIPEAASKTSTAESQKGTGRSAVFRFLKLSHGSTAEKEIYTLTIQRHIPLTAEKEAVS